MERLDQLYNSPIQNSDNTAAVPRRRIPRPWLDKKNFVPNLSVEAGPAAAQPRVATIAEEDEPPTLLEERSVTVQSVFQKLDWCFCPPEEEEDDEDDEEPKQANARSLQAAYFADEASSFVRTPNLNESPILRARREPSFDDNSSFVMAPRPTVIYVFEGAPSPLAHEHKAWHQAYLSPVSQPKTARDRFSSFESSLTSWSREEDDSLAFSADRPPASRQRTNTGTLLERPPIIQDRSKTTASPSKRPPMVPRPKAYMDGRQRANTTGSVGSKHRRSRGNADFMFDSDTLSQLHSFDEESTLASTEHSSVFPMLPSDALNHESSPRGIDGTKRAPIQYEGFEGEMGDSVVLSGWVAYSLGDSLLNKRKVSDRYVAYLVICSGDNKIYLKQPKTAGERTSEDDDSEENRDVSVTLSAGSSIQTMESNSLGRCIVIRDGLDRIVCTLLPVDTSNQKMGPTVAHHDAVLHFWFGLDGWCRREVNVAANISA